LSTHTLIISTIVYVVSDFCAVCLNIAFSPKQTSNNMGCEICLGFKPESPPKKLDAVDLQIIRALEEDSRVSLRKLAHKLMLTPNILNNRIKSLEKEGIIKGYAPIVEATKMGYALTAIIMIQVEGGHMLEIENEIAKESNVLSVYDITGEFDAVVIAKFRDTASLNGFLKKLLSERFIKRTATLVSLNAVKEYCKIL
jgi:Lrp/AsnC family transcriptional regulator, regulator for asnA, asnC and gidA